MKEITDIIKAYHIALTQHKKMALATVVHVEGSSYRRPGARMLVTDDGKLTGAISGGCLEGDALRKALLAINENTNKLVTYDTTDEDDVKFGVQLGCNGIVHILFEPIDETAPNNPISLLKQALEFRSRSIIAVLFSTEQRSGSQMGTYLCKSEQGMFCNERLQIEQAISDDLKKKVLIETALQSLEFYSYPTAEGVLTALVETLQPTLHLVICGAGNDAIPLMNIAKLLGWRITVIDGRQTHATPERFPDTTIIVAKASVALTDLHHDEHTCYMLMTHNYNYDLELLKQVVHKNTPYVGILGPKTKLKRMMDDLSTDGVMTSDLQQEKIHGPAGLDIGAETAEEIAVSIVAEIKAVMEKRNAGFLKNKMQPIHSN